MVLRSPNFTTTDSKPTILSFARPFLSGFLFCSLFGRNEAGIKPQSHSGHDSRSASSISLPVVKSRNSVAASCFGLARHAAAPAPSVTQF